MKILQAPHTFILLILFLSLWKGQGWASSRSSGMANASVTLADVWSLQNNQAGLGFMNRIGAGISYQDQFVLKELSTKALSLAAPTKHGTFGLYISNYGYTLYKQNKYGLAFGKAFGKNLSFGVMMDYLETSISEYGKKGAFVAEAGIQAKPLKRFTIGMHIFNLTRTKLNAYNDERIPTIMRLGGDYRFSTKVLIALEAEKDIDKRGVAKVGLEYRPIKELFLRAGISSNPSLTCFGIGLEMKQFKLDLSSTYHSTFGFSPQISLIYEFDKIRK